MMAWDPKRGKVSLRKIRRREETRLVRTCMDQWRAAGCLVWRQNNLPVPEIVRRNGDGTVVARLRPVEVKGIADMGGVAPGGRAIQVEYKTADGRVAPEQKAWLTAVAHNGGIAMLVRSTAEVMCFLNEAKRQGWERVASPWPAIAPRSRRRPS